MLVLVLVPYSNCLSASSPLSLLAQAELWAVELWPGGGLQVAVEEAGRMGQMLAALADKVHRLGVELAVGCTFGAVVAVLIVASTSWPVEARL